MQPASFWAHHAHVYVPPPKADQVELSTHEEAGDEAGDDLRPHGLGRRWFSRAATDKKKQAAGQSLPAHGAGIVGGDAADEGEAGGEAAGGERGAAGGGDDAGHVPHVTGQAVVWPYWLL